LFFFFYEDAVDEKMNLCDDFKIEQGRIQDSFSGGGTKN